MEQITEKKDDREKKSDLEKTKEIFLKSIDHLNKDEQALLLKLYDELIKDM